MMLSQFISKKKGISQYFNPTLHQRNEAKPLYIVMLDKESRMTVIKSGKISKVEFGKTSFWITLLDNFFYVTYICG